ARYDALSRNYRYTLSERKSPLSRFYSWQVKYHLSRELLEEATRSLVGRCNLRGFSKGADDEDFSTIIFKNSWEFTGNLMIFNVSAVRFFHHAVRSIVGSAVEVARGKESPDFLERILKTGDRSLAGPTAPATGLCLVSVDYGKETIASEI
ncbi:MAG: tRNA pseudouridine(38-40) synthase TruA, partial [Candidatus Latescibacterota bacterium]